MYLHAVGGGKGTRPNQQQQHQQQQQNHINLGSHHHHPHHHQPTHYHQSATLLHQSTPPPTPPLLHAAAIHHLGQQQVQQQQQQQTTVAPNTSQPPPIAHLQHHTAGGHTQLYYLGPPPVPPTAVTTQNAGNVVQQMAPNQNQQKSAGGSRERHHQQHAQQQQQQQQQQQHHCVNNAGNGATFMTPTFLQGYQQQAVMATVAAQYNNAAGVPQNTAQMYQQATAAAAAVGGSQAQSHPHHNHGQSPSTQYSYYQQPMVAGPSGTQLTAAGHQQIRGMLAQRPPLMAPQPNYVIPTQIFAAVQAPQRGTLLTSAAQNNAAHNGTSLLQNNGNRQASGVQTAAYITPPFCPPALALGGPGLAAPQPLLAQMQPYAHLPPPATPALSAVGFTGSYTPHEKKNRPHAIPIIHPETKQNILDPKPLTETATNKQDDKEEKVQEEVEAEKVVESQTNKDVNIKPKEIDKAITVSIAEAPPQECYISDSEVIATTTSSGSVAVVSEKIDQQMQTDAVQKTDKIIYSKSCKDKSTTATPTDTAKATENDECGGNYYTATTTTKERVYVTCEQQQQSQSQQENDDTQQETSIEYEQISDDSMTYSSNANYGKK